MIVTYTGTSAGTFTVSAGDIFSFLTAGTWSVTVDAEITCTFKGAAGGASGEAGQNAPGALNGGFGGRGGGGGAVSNGTPITLLIGHTYTVVIGAAGGLTKITDATTTVVLLHLAPGTIPLGGALIVGSNGVSGSQGGIGGNGGTGATSPGTAGSNNSTGAAGGGGGGGGDTGSGPATGPGADGIGSSSVNAGASFAGVIGQFGGGGTGGQGGNEPASAGGAGLAGQNGAGVFLVLTVLPSHFKMGVTPDYYPRHNHRVIKGF